MKRSFDFALASIIGFALLPVVLGVAFLIWLTDGRPIFHISSRMGQNNKIFHMPKFRTMRVGAPNLATHKMTNPDQWMTTIGPFLRKSSIDEIPQLWSILKGEMSFVGPRPALFNQDDLINMRMGRGIDVLRPGLTGWAQINGRDTISLADKVALDAHYLKNQCFWFDIRILLKTALRVFSSRDIVH